MYSILLILLKLFLFLLYGLFLTILNIYLALNQRKIRRKYKIDLIIFFMLLYLLNFLLDFYLFSSPFYLSQLLLTCISVLIIVKLNNCQIIGLTGGIACGKSTVSNILKEEFDLEVIDCDFLARKIVEVGKPAYRKIVKIFGEGVLMENGEINRRKLGEVVFGDRGMRGRLTRVTGFYIFIEIVKEVYRILIKEKKGYAVLDAPLMFESKYLEYFCYPIMCVYVTEENIQIERIIKRDGLSEEQARNRIKSQMNIREKIKKSEILIPNEQTIEDLNKNVKNKLALYLV